MTPPTSDYTDGDCLLIHTSIESATSPSSALFINEVALPNKDATWHATQRDEALILGVEARERMAAALNSGTKMSYLKAGYYAVTAAV